MPWLNKDDSIRVKTDTITKTNNWKTKAYIIDDSFAVSKDGSCCSYIKNSRTKKWDLLVLCVPSENISFNSRIDNIRSKVKFLLHPNTKDEVFMEQVKSSSKKLYNKLR